MATFKPGSAVVTLRKSGQGYESSVSVGIAIYQPQKDPAGKGINLNEVSLNKWPACATWYRSDDDLTLACELSIANAIENFQKRHDRPIGYRITLLKGNNLTSDCTVGFALGASIAASRATGLPAAMERDLLDWREE